MIRGAGSRLLAARSLTELTLRTRTPHDMSLYRYVQSPHVVDRIHTRLRLHTEAELRHCRRQGDAVVYFMFFSSRK
jgi:hypothetical protein